VERSRRVRLPLRITEVIPKGVVCSLKGAVDGDDRQRQTSPRCAQPITRHPRGACYNDARVEVAAL